MLSQKRPDSQTATLLVPRPAVVRVLLCGACLVVAYATLLPFRFTFDRVLIGEGALQRLLLQRSPTLLSDLVGNVMLFVPVGALAWMGSSPDRRNGAGLWRAALAGVTFSFAIEILQCFTPTRTPAVNDVLANGLGSLLGAAAARFTWPRLRRLSSVASLSRSSRREPLLMALAGLVILVAIQAVVPFDYSLHPQAIRRALGMAVFDPRLDPAPFIDASRLLLFAFFGGVALQTTRILKPLGIGSRIALALGGTACVALLLEAPQILFKSHLVSLQDVLGAVLGAALGIAVALLLAQSQRHSWSLVTLAYALALLLATSGMLGASGVEIMHARLQALAPDYAEHYSTNLAAVSRFTEHFLLLVPLGFLLAREMGRRWRSAPWNTILVTLACVVWALLLERFRAGEERSTLSWCVAAAFGGLVGSTGWLWFEASRHATDAGQNEVAGSHEIA